MFSTLIWSRSGIAWGLGLKVMHKFWVISADPLPLQHHYHHSSHTHTPLAMINVSHFGVSFRNFLGNSLGSLYYLEIPTPPQHTQRMLVARGLPHFSTNWKKKVCKVAPSDWGARGLGIWCLGGWERSSGELVSGWWLVVVVPIPNTHTTDRRPGKNSYTGANGNKDFDKLESYPKIL